MKNLKIIALITSLLFGLSSYTVQAESTEQKLVKHLSTLLDGITEKDISKTQISGIYEVVFDTNVIYISKDGRYVFQGEITDAITGINLTKKKKGDLANGLISSIADKDKIIFPAKDQKYVINVFTDVDCPFCARLHREIPRLNELGVTVKYLASPLAQLHPDALAKMQSIWCADDRAKALDNYKRFKKFTKKDCPAGELVKQQLDLAERLGVNGTPSIFLSNGEKIAGYMKADRLIKLIKNAQ